MIAKLKTALHHKEAKQMEEKSRTALDKELERVKELLDAEAKKKAVPTAGRA